MFHVKSFKFLPRKIFVPIKLSDLFVRKCPGKFRTYSGQIFGQNVRKNIFAFLPEFRTKFRTNFRAKYFLVFVRIRTKFRTNYRKKYSKIYTNLQTEKYEKKVVKKPLFACKTHKLIENLKNQQLPLRVFQLSRNNGFFF